MGDLGLGKGVWAEVAFKFGLKGGIKVHQVRRVWEGEDIPGGEDCVSQSLVAASLWCAGERWVGGMA